jgi:hypothetical protein
MIGPTQGVQTSPHADGNAPAKAGRGPAARPAAGLLPDVGDARSEDLEAVAERGDDHHRAEAGDQDDRHHPEGVGVDADRLHDRRERHREQGEARHEARDHPERARLAAAHPSREHDREHRQDARGEDRDHSRQKREREEH